MYNEMTELKNEQNSFSTSKSAVNVYKKKTCYSVSWSLRSSIFSLSTPIQSQSEDDPTLLE